MKRTIAFSLMFFAGLMLMLSGCHIANSSTNRVKPQAAVDTIFADLSGSTALMTSMPYADGAVDQIGSIIVRQHLGDAVRLLAIGSRTSDRAVDILSIASDRKQRLPKVRQLVEDRLRSLLAEARRSGGDGRTNILFTLENAHPVCTPRSAIVLLSDGLEDSDAYSVPQMLAKHQPMRLPPPATPYLKGCAVEFIGIGMSPEAAKDGTTQTLPNDQLKILIAGWREYLTAAGVKPDEMTFRSIL